MFCVKFTFSFPSLEEIPRKGMTKSKDMKIFEIVSPYGYKNEFVIC